MNDFELCHLSIDLAEDLAATARAQGIQTLIGALIVRPDGRLFAQRRSQTRKFGAGFWDNVGGHVDPEDTSLQDALAREITEETGWTLESTGPVIAKRMWQGPSTQQNLEFIVLCRTHGNMDNPVLEAGKIDATLWVDTNNVARLNESRGEDTSQQMIYAHGLVHAQRFLEQQEPSR